MHKGPENSPELIFRLLSPISTVLKPRKEGLLFWFTF